MSEGLRTVMKPPSRLKAAFFNSGKQEARVPWF